MFPKKLEQDFRSVFCHAPVPAFPAPYSIESGVKVMGRQHFGSFALSEIVAGSPVFQFVQSFIDYGGLFGAHVSFGIQGSKVRHVSIKSESEKCPNKFAIATCRNQFSG
jgi:hypothetical protein